MPPVCSVVQRHCAGCDGFPCSSQMLPLSRNRRSHPTQGRGCEGRSLSLSSGCSGRCLGQGLPPVSCKCGSGSRRWYGCLAWCSPFLSPRGLTVSLEQTGPPPLPSFPSGCPRFHFLSERGWQGLLWVLIPALCVGASYHITPPAVPTPWALPRTPIPLLPASSEQLCSVCSALDRCFHQVPCGPAGSCQ